MKLNLLTAAVAVLFCTVAVTHAAAPAQIAGQDGKPAIVLVHGACVAAIIPFSVGVRSWAKSVAIVAGGSQRKPPSSLIRVFS